jgi:hypothetical protein
VLHEIEGPVRSAMGACVWLKPTLAPREVSPGRTPAVVSGVVSVPAPFRRSIAKTGFTRVALASGEYSSLKSLNGRKHKQEHHMFMNNG